MFVCLSQDMTFPALDDEFAAKIGAAKNLADLKTKIRDSIAQVPPYPPPWRWRLRDVSNDGSRAVLMHFWDGSGAV